MTSSYVNRNVSRAEYRPRIDHQTFRAHFESCARCGIVRDLRCGKYLSERDAQELDAIFADCHPPLPVGPVCPWCEEDLSGRKGR